MSKQHPLMRFYHKVGLVPQIIIGLLAGIVLALISTEAALRVGILGELFVNALKSVAPILVLVLVSASITAHKKGKKTNIKHLVGLYFASMVAAALVAVLASFIFPSKISLLVDQTVDIKPPSGISEVLGTLLLKMIDNPFHALINANYIGLIVWGVGLGVALRHASETTKHMMADLSYALSFIVKIIIRLAPLGVFGLVAATLAKTGFAELYHYLHLLLVLVGCMLVVALVINPLLAFVVMRKNPYPLVFTALKESGIPAFFTRSSAANIPVNMALCKKLNMDEDVYSVAVPLGATINMSGAAVTITILTLAAVYSMHIPIDIYSALLLCVVSAVCACGASGIAGGSLLLIPIACSMFGIPNEVAVNVIAIGIAIGVIQDSIETAINSSSDVVFVGAICENLPAKQNAAEQEII